MSSTWSESDISLLSEKINALRAAIAQKVVGQSETVDELLMALFAGGHALIEGVPGLGKTLLVKTLAEAISLQFNRIQFTPDLMPSDVIGTELLEEEHGSGKRVFRFQRGPIFTQILLADEINRTPPKTQAALLEAMQESAVTFAGERHMLPQPFFVLATQNPIEQSGTYPLPEAQLDRFLLHIEVRYPSFEEEFQIVQQTTTHHNVDVQAVMDVETLTKVQRLVKDVSVSTRLMSYAVNLVRETRPAETQFKLVKEYVSWGAGTRAAQALVLCAKANAVLNGRVVVTRDDFKRVLPSVLRHRLVLGFQAEADNVRFNDIASDLLTLAMPV